MSQSKKFSPPKDLNEKTAKKINKLSQLAKDWKMELNHLALAYMLTLPGMGPVIPASSTVKQLESNALAGKIKLTEEQQKQIKTILREP